jgi:hypothetical protein
LAISREHFTCCVPKSTFVWLLGSFQNLFLWNPADNTIRTCLHGHKPSPTCSRPWQKAMVMHRNRSCHELMPEDYKIVGTLLPASRFACDFAFCTKIRSRRIGSHFSTESHRPFGPVMPIYSVYIIGEPELYLIIRVCALSSLDKIDCITRT